MSDTQIVSDSDDESRRLEQLVSWLDSELDDEQTQQMELQLRKDAALRRQAEAFERAWGMLDALEPVSADQSFTQQTIQTVYQNSGDTGQRKAARSDRQLAATLTLAKILTWFLLGFVCTMLGLQTVRLIAPAPDTSRDTQILENIDLLNRYPEYSAARNLHLLRQLRETPGENGSDVATPDNSAEDTE